MLLASGSDDHKVIVWNTKTGRAFATLERHFGIITGITWSPDGSRLASSSDDGIILVWNAKKKDFVSKFYRDWTSITSLEWSKNGKYLAAGSGEGLIFIWDVDREKLVKKINAHHEYVHCLMWSNDSECLASGSGDQKIKIWKTTDWKINKVLKGRLGDINSISWSPDCKLLAAGCEDRCIHIWNVNSGREETVLEGHTSYVRHIAFSSDGKLLASKSPDKTMRIWRCDTWVPILIINENCSTNYGGIAFHPKEPLIASRLDKIDQHDINLFKLDYNSIFDKLSSEETIHYTTAKIALVGDSGVGKTGLGWRLSQRNYKEHSSTHGQQFWVVEELSTKRKDGTECESVIWDFAGQPDYRLVHSLFLDDVDLALILFDPVNREKPLSGVEFWLNQLSFSKNNNCRRILVGARVDRGVSPITENELKLYCEKHSITGGYIPTSAKTGDGIPELVREINNQIVWDEMPATVTTKTFKIIKEYVLKLKEKLNCTDDEKYEILVTPERLAKLITEEHKELTFTESEMITAVKHLENHGYILILKRTTGQVIILLSPDIIINFASSLVLEARRNSRGLGSLEEEVLLKKGYNFAELVKLSDNEQNILIDAATYLFIEHNICFRETYNEKTYLVFPSLINEKRPLIEEYKTVDDVSYRISGPVENVYASLVVLLGYTNLFARLNQWQNQALFSIEGGSLCGFKQIMEHENELELILYYGIDSPEDLRLLFQGMIERLLKMRDLKILRYKPLKCRKCNELQERSSVMKQIEKLKNVMHCIECGEKLSIPSVEEITKLKRHERMRLEDGQNTARRRTEFESALVWVKGLLRDRGDSKRPTCFISYAWGNLEHEKWVQSLAKALRNADIDIIFDRWHNPPGSSITKFIERIEKADFIIVIGTPEYLLKYNDESNNAVVDAEIRLINTRVRQKKLVSETVIPLLLADTADKSFPPLLRDSVYVNNTNKDNYLNNLFDIILTIYKIPFDHPSVIDFREKNLFKQQGLEG
jgi:small GTP-binding protein